MKSKTPATASTRTRHRVAVSVKFSHRINEATAVKALNAVLERVDLAMLPALSGVKAFGFEDLYVETLKAKRS